MSRSFFADQNARISRNCSLNRDDMYRIIEHTISPVDRVAVARGCRERMVQAVKIISDYGPRRFRGAGEDLYKAVQFTLRTIDELQRPRYGESEVERPVELETAALLAEMIPLVVRTETLKIRQLQELRRALLKSLSRANDLSRVSHGADPALLQLDRELLMEIGRNAWTLGGLLDDALCEIPHKIAKLRGPRRYNHDEPCGLQA